MLLNLNFSKVGGLILRLEHTVRHYRASIEYTITHNTVVDSDIVSSKRLRRHHLLRRLMERS
jgi:hypothetical protein